MARKHYEEVDNLDDYEGGVILAGAEEFGTEEERVEFERSFRAQIEGLDIGATFSRAQRYDADQTLKDVPMEALRAWRLGMQPTVYRIEKRTGMKFTIECGEWRTQSRDIIACLAITRTA